MSEPRGDVGAASRLHSAARALAPVMPAGPDQPRVTAMATTPPSKWTTAHIKAAAVTMRRYRELLVRNGIRPEELINEATPGPGRPERVTGASLAQQWAADAKALFDAAEEPQPPAVAGETVEPFQYEGTIVGLRGIPVTELSAVSAKAAVGFEQAGIGSVYDLLQHIPLRYVDRSRRVPIAQLIPGETGTTIATVRSSKTDTTRRGMRLARIVLEDPAGSTITCTFFNTPWQAKRFTPGDEVVAQGKVSVWENNLGVGFLQMTNPLLDRTGDNHAAVVPIYPQHGTGADSARARLTTWQIHRAAMEAIDRMGELADPIPEAVLHRRGLLGRTRSYAQVHRPASPGEETDARRRLAYDELLRMQLALQMRRAAARSVAGVRHRPTGALTEGLLARFRYPLTGAQRQAVQVIRDDMTAPHPMHRLLQGDVGSGKSVVAALTLLTGVEGGYQGALMAPTELLATQLFNELCDLTEGVRLPDGTDLVVRALTNKVRSKARQQTLTGLADGSVHLVVGTHALLSDDVQFQALGVVVVDEQHRFGVEQRALLRDKGSAGATPDTLVMTATPIPRTAAMTVFGDLDVTILDELPPGRTRIATTWEESLPGLGDRSDPTWVQLREQITAGRQGYVVCPLVEESETKAAAAAVDVAEQLQAGALAGCRVGLVHGKQHPDDRAEAMQQFRDGNIDVLVATTVIEVGVSVPNATMIVVLEPQSFGIAQLHQLRGRVGRGRHASRCVLAGPASNDDGARRLQALCDTTDGFRLSEVDLQLRGPGQILGSAQHGLSDLRVASLTTDQGLLLAAREDARTLLQGNERLESRPTLLAEVRAALGPEGDTWLSRG